MSNFVGILQFLNPLWIPLFRITGVVMINLVPIINCPWEMHGELNWPYADHIMISSLDLNALNGAPSLIAIDLKRYIFICQRFN